MKSNLNIKPFDFYLTRINYDIDEILRRADVPASISQRLKSRLLVFAVDENLRWADERKARIAACKASVKSKTADLRSQTRNILALDKLPNDLREHAENALSNFN
jgi:hypothetical protein